MDVTADGTVESTAAWSPAGWAEHRLTPVVSRHSVPSCGWRIDGPSTALVVSGDTASPGLDSDLPGPDVLVHEATYLEEHADRAEGHLHSTAAGAARTALHLDARGLALTTSAPAWPTWVLRWPRPLLCSGRCSMRGPERRRPVDRPADGTVHHLSREDVGWDARLLVEGRR